ncbi:MAG: ABC transporter substrate-binding protein [Chloroflexota bacterium]
MLGQRELHKMLRGGRDHRRSRRSRATWTAVVLSALLALVACAPQAAPPAPTTAPAKPAEAAKPTAAAAAPAAAPAAKPTEAAKPAAAAKPAEAAKPTTAPAAAAKPAESKPAAPAAASVPKVTPTGSVVIAQGEEPPTLMMWEAYSSFGYTVIRNVAEGLVNRDPANNQLVGELATKWEATNPTTWRFTLRPNVKFHDGSPFNAEAAAASLNETWGKEKNYRIRTFIGPEFQAKAVDDLTLDIVTESPDPILPERLYFSPIGSLKQMKENPDEVPLKAIGTGPYVFVEWQKGQHIKLTANPDWWGNGSADAKGVASIKDVTFQFRAEREVRAAMTKAGEADIARWITGEQCKGTPNCQASPSLETIFVRMDTNNVAMKDKRVREAIALSIDKEAIIKEVMGGGDVARQLVGPSATGYNPNLQPYPFDMAKAEQLIAQAKADGVPVDAPLTNYVRRAYIVGLEEATEAIAQSMVEIGLVNTKTRGVETAAHQELWGANTGPGSIDPNRGMLGTHSHGNELMDYSSTVTAYYTCKARNSVVCDEKLEEMHQKALPLKGTEREKAYQDIAKYIHEQFYTVPIGHPNFYYGLSDKVEWKPRLDGFIMVKEMKLK